MMDVYGNNQEYHDSYLSDIASVSFPSSSSNQSIDEAILSTPAERGAC